MKFRDADAIKGKSDQYTVDPRLLHIEPGFNVRDLQTPEAREKLDILKGQIRSYGGVRVPLELRLGDDDKLYVVNGHRRLTATMELIAEGMEILTVPAVQEPRFTTEGQRIVGMLQTGEDLQPIERANGILRLIRMGWDRAKIAGELGFKSVQTVANYELLLSAPDDVREAVQQGEVSASNAVAMVRAGDASASLTRARATAKAKGKTKITAAAMPKGGRSASAIEARNEAKLAKSDADHNAAPSYQVEKAFALLAAVLHNGYAPGAAATAYAALPLATVSQIAEWVYEFEDRLKAKQDERSEATPPYTIAPEPEEAFA